MSGPLEACRGRLIVSCQAAEGEAFRDPEAIARFARAAADGGAAGIRACGVEDVRAIRRAVGLPVIGIDKVMQEDGRILITPTVEGARRLVEAGAAAVALDCTARGQRSGALERLAAIRGELKVPALADIATVEEAEAAAAAGADFVLSTMRGYTDDTAGVSRFEPSFIAALVRTAGAPVIAEGRIWTPEEAEAAISAGAFAVIVGSAITRPAMLTRRLADAVGRGAGRAESIILAIDLGGTNTKYGVVRGDGRLLAESTEPTPAGGGAVLMEHLKGVTVRCAALASAMAVRPAALGVATAGWVDAGTGRVAYATENLPGWTGARIAETLSPLAGLPVAVENDANALAVGEKRFGAARDLDDFVVVTLGTGVGGGCYIGGRLNRGSHFFANALGHISLEPGGLPCTCGSRGCLETYANAAALIRYAAGRFPSAEAVIAAANGGDAVAASAIRSLADALARGCASIIHLLDPQALVVSGGLAQNNPVLFAALEASLADYVNLWARRGLAVLPSPLGYHGGVYGAAAVALENP